METEATYLKTLASVAVPGTCGPVDACLFSLRFLLGVLSYLDHAFVVALHAVDALAGLCKDELVDAILADLALEAVCMVRIVTGHDRLVKYRVMADIAAVRAVCANGGTIGEQEEICVCGDLVSTLCAFEAVDVEEGLTEKTGSALGREQGQNGPKSDDETTLFSYGRALATWTETVVEVDGGVDGGIHCGQHKKRVKGCSAPSPNHPKASGFQKVQSGRRSFRGARAAY
jgi:hypothetical protein